MRRLSFPLILLLCMACLSCATKAEKEAAQTEAEDAALRSVVGASCAQVPVTLFQDFTMEQFVGPDSEKLKAAGDIPLLSGNLELYRDQARDAFRATLLSLHDLVRPYGDKLVFGDTHQVILSSDDSVTILLGKQFGDEIKLQIKDILEKESTEAKTTRDTIMTLYTIWDRGKRLLGEEPLPMVRFLDDDELVSLLYDTYMSNLAKEEIDVRTTPRMQGTGSLYEFFSSIKPAGKKQ